MPRIALIGDYSASVVAHQAIPLALARACADEAITSVSWDWIATRELTDPATDLKNFSAVWLVPASPYENTEGALSAVRFARETKRPFLGTCGGFQHALIEFARNVLKLAEADHAETNPSGPLLVVSRLSCSLVEQSRTITFAPHSRLRELFGSDSAEVSYHCNYGPNPAYRAAFEQAGFQFTAWDSEGEPRAGELSASLHPFFVGTLFQSERDALRGKTPPIVRAFVKAAAAYSR
jgi:CTP synthase (UTP-ammonia lyase)